MLEKDAREILGVISSTSYADIKKRYRQLAKVMHPDNARIDAADKVQAASAMARVNEAWETIESRQKSGLLGTLETESSQFSTQSRIPNSSECFICGFIPATYFKAPSVSSFIIWGHLRGFEGVACKNCGLSMSRLAMRDSLRKGWWGLGILSMPWVIYSWLKNENKFRKLGKPENRDPLIVSMLPYPSPIERNPLKDPLSVIATMVAVVLVVFVILQPNPNSQGAGGIDSSQFGLQGTCYTVDSAKQTVGLDNCSNPFAVQTSLGEATDQASCPTGTEDSISITKQDGTKGVACLGPWGGVAPSKICYSLEGNPKMTFDCSTYPQISISVCQSHKYATFVAVDSTGAVLNQLSPPNGGVWSGIRGNACSASYYAFNFLGSEPRRVGNYKFRINFSNIDNPRDVLDKKTESSIWDETVS